MKKFAGLAAVAALATSLMAVPAISQEVPPTTPGGVIPPGTPLIGGLPTVAVVVGGIAAAIVVGIALDGGGDGSPATPPVTPGT